MNALTTRQTACLAVFLLLFLSLQAQVSSTTPSPNSVVPPSPTAASLGKYGAIPVSTYTGIPNINIPVYTVQSGSLNLPISLSYHASGIRVSEEASWVGLGWSLFTGGVITRAIRGLDDFTDVSGAGYTDYVFPLTINNNNEYVPSSALPWNELNFLKDVYLRWKDPEPDIFYFNFAGHSGKFTIAQRTSAGDPYVFNIESQEKIRIELIQGGADRSWVFTTVDGKQYFFSTPEKTKSYSFGSSGNEPSPDLMFSDFEPQKMTSTWYLDKITSPDGNAIDFEYTTPSATGMLPCASRSENRSHLLGTDIQWQSGCDPESPPSTHMYYSSHSIVYDVYLKKILFSNGQIVFETSARNDIKPFSIESLPQKLDKIHIYKKNGENLFEEIKTVDFNYDYFTNYDTHLDYLKGFYQYTYSKTYSSKRLKLLGVTEKSGASQMPSTQFEYISSDYPYGDIPDKYSKAQDHWGYFNNKGNTLVPDAHTTGGFVSTLLPPYADLGRNTYYNGANKTSDEVQMQLGTLKKITYPTGGATEFRYGINEYGNFPTEYVKEQHTEMLLGIGENVDQAEEPGLDPDIPSTFQLNLTEATSLSVRVNAGYSLLFDCVNISWGGEGGMYIRSTGATPFFQQFVVGTTQCHGSPDITSVIVVPPGTYEVKSYATNQVLTYATVSWEQVSDSPLLSKKGAGLRIEKVIDYDGVDHNNDIITEYKYTRKVGGVEKTSGILMSPLIYEYEDARQRSIDCDNGSGVVFSSTYLNRSSESVLPLGSSAQGKTIGYTSVTVLYGENGVKGKTVYTYKNEPERLPYQFMPNLPCTPDPGNGLLISQIDYKYNPDITAGEPYQKVKELIRDYVNETDSRKVTKGMKCNGCEFIQENQVNGVTFIPLVKFYDNLSEWWHLASETIHQYNNSDENSLLTSTTEFFYENPVHLQLTKTVSTVNNSKITTAFKYPLDYSNVTASDEISVGVLNLQQNHILNPVIEKTVFRSDISGTNSRLLNAVFTQYDGKNPTKVHAMEESAPVTNFVASGMQSGAVVKDNRYVPQIIYDKYGDQGNLMQFHKSSDANQSFLWDVTNIYPIAEAKNTAVEDISYTSFEQNESTSWHYLGAINGSSAITGKRSYSLAEGAIAKSGLSVSKKYIVSYWTTSGSNYLIAGTQGDVIRGVSINGWTYFKHVVVGQSEISIAGTGFIDELRLYPEGAQMATYTYEPLIGITSKCDVNDFISYYEYDEFSRLKIVRDQNGNIVKRICYNYSGQSTPCAN